MAKRRALIVDDSKTAQIRLGKMLESFNLEVDTVLSAEEALGYLSYRQPSVLFLDHHMEGMDGLEALKIIKSNPDTALIPVIMYTSEKGDVYVGQARALGAMDIIGKGAIKHENLEKVLKSLGISSANDSEAATPTSPQSRPKSKVEGERPQDTPASRAEAFRDNNQAEINNDLDTVRKHVSRLFEIHIAKVRQEIAESTKSLLLRIARVEKSRPIPPHTTQDLSKSPVDAEPVVVEAPGAGVSNVFLGLILIGVAFLGYHLYINNRYQQLQSDQYQELIERNKAQEALIGRLLKQSDERPVAPKDSAADFAERQVLLDSLSWAVNVNTQFGFGEKALTDERTYMLGELVALLNAANFSGIIYMDVHLGNYCVVQDPSGGWILPAFESNIEECLFMDSLAQEQVIEDLASMGFLHYVSSSPSLNEGKIFLEMAVRGYADTLASYPPKTSGTSAGEWNAIAQKNNRFNISFSAN